MTEPILITGCARSRTSMVAGIINYCGAFGGKMVGQNYNSPEKGLYENRQIREKVIKPYLQELGLDPLGQHPLANIDNIHIPRDWHNRFRQIMRSEGWNGKQPWFYKGAKMCQIWPALDNNFPNAKWIIVRREADGIINSCLRTSFMKAFRDYDGWEWWVEQHKHRFMEMFERGMDCMEIWTDRIVKGDYGEIKEAVQWAGLNWNWEKAKQIIIHGE